MPTRIDWELIKEHVTSNDMLLFAFPRQFQQLLLTNADNLRWLATYRMEHYDFSDWDTLQSVVDAGIDQLMGGIMLSDIIGYIDEIETKLDQLINKADCCLPDGITTFFGPTPLPATPDYPYDGETYPATYAGIAMDDLEDYQAHLCGAANSMIDNIIAGLDNVQGQWNVGGQIFGVVAAFLSLVAGFTLVGIPVAIAIATGSAAAIVAAGAGIAGLFSGAADDIEDARNALICLALHDTPENFAAGMETLVSDLAWSTLLQYLNYNDMIASLYSGQVNGENITVTPTTENCTCLPEADFDLEFTFDADADGWTTVQTTWDASHNGSMKQVPTSPQYSYLSFTQADFLSATGYPSGTEIEITLLEMDCYLLDVVAGGAPLFLMEAYTSPVKTEISAAYNSWTKGVELYNVEAIASQAATKVITTAGGAFLMVHLQHKGTPVPNAYVSRIRLRGNIV